MSAPSHTAARKILLVDCDAFYVQVARLEDPEGAGRAEYLIVGGSSSGRGVVTSASYSCREFGVHSAMPTGRALRLCPQAMVAPVSRSACSERSRRVRDALRTLAPLVQAASIDEFYLDLTGMDRMLAGESLVESGRRIQAAVLAASEIRVSIGGGTNRLVAKLAAGRAKPNGVFVVPPGGEADFIAELALADLPGVGPKLVAALSERGLRGVADVRRVERDWLERWLGDSRAEWLLRRVWGRDDSPVVHGERRKSVSSERTFSRDLDATEELERELLRLSVSVTASLRKEGLRARTLSVKVRTSDFTTRQRAHTFGDPVESDTVVFPVARRLLAELRARRRGRVRLLGVGLSNLVAHDVPAQLALFTEGVHAPGDSETERDRALARTVDVLRTRFGKDAVLPGRIVDPSPGRLETLRSADGREPESPS
ncbi:MAG: DNA polymerase IV [Gemmatimonadetes bacterium]|nr:DNA polymerase IV [Gemmatimonadota bacterium]